MPSGVHIEAAVGIGANARHRANLVEVDIGRGRLYLLFFALLQWGDAIAKAGVVEHETRGGAGRVFAVYFRSFGAEARLAARLAREKNMGSGIDEERGFNVHFARRVCGDNKVDLPTLCFDRAAAGV